MSQYGAKHGLPGYDRFRTGLTYQDVFDLLKDNEENSSKWRYKRRRTVLGFWHQLKKEMYERAIDSGCRP